MTARVAVTGMAGLTSLGQDYDAVMRAASLDYIVAAPRTLSTEYVMSNNFAFGGINTSLIFRCVS